MTKRQVETMTMMTTLVVQRPRGQRDEVFHDRALDSTSGLEWNRCYEFRVYSYRVEGNVLRVYSHTVDWQRYSGIDWDSATKGIEVAHFRPNQWDMVRNGR